MVALRKRAKDVGATAEDLLEAMDADEPKQTIVALILTMRESTGSGCLE